MWLLDCRKVSSFTLCTLDKVTPPCRLKFLKRPCHKHARLKGRELRQMMPFVKCYCAIWWNKNEEWWLVLCCASVPYSKWETSKSSWFWRDFSPLKPRYLIAYTALQLSCGILRGCVTYTFCCKFAALVISPHHSSRGHTFLPLWSLFA